MTIKHCGQSTARSANRKAVMRLKDIASLALLLAAAVACGSRTPSPDSARQAFASRLDGGSDARLRPVSFEKTDGRTVELMGMKGYELMFVADAEFMSNAMFSGGSPLLSQGSEIVTAEYREPSSGSSWDSFLAASQGFHPAMKGDRLHFVGSVRFERRESGWSPIGVQFTFNHDDTTRDTAAIRRAQELRQQEEAQSERLEAERAERLAREQAARDAAAERTSFVIQGPTARGYESGAYWIGRLTSSDVLLFQPIKGDLQEVSVLVDSSSKRYPDRHNHPAGDHVSRGEFGGTSYGYKISRGVRVDMQRIRGTGTRDIFVTLYGSGDVEVGVTILCHPVDGAPPCSGR